MMTWMSCLRCATLLRDELLVFGDGELDVWVAA